IFFPRFDLYYLSGFCNYPRRLSCWRYGFQLFVCFQTHYFLHFDLCFLLILQFLFLLFGLHDFRFNSIFLNINSVIS
ncbi:hypothetical protein L9F63_006765, partial [Diploptera punctata]